MSLNFEFRADATKLLKKTNCSAHKNKQNGPIKQAKLLKKKQERLENKNLKKCREILKAMCINLAGIAE